MKNQRLLRDEILALRVRQVLNIAHRGFSGRFPENTLLAFQKALEVGADGIECDLGITKDREPVLFHDTQLKRLCGVRGRLEEITWKDLSKLKILGQESPCHLRELLSLSGSFRLNIELKLTARVTELLDALEQELSGLLDTKRILISSFSAALLTECHRRFPERFRLALLLQSFSEKKFLRMKSCPWIQQWNVKATALSDPQALWDRSCWAWTVNHPEDWASLLKIANAGRPLEGIITDAPDQLAQFLSHQSA